MAKIAAELIRAVAHRAQCGGSGSPTTRVLAQGPGWTVEDVICTSGPGDRAYEERHSRVSIAIVAAGTFQYRSSAGRDLMTPGSLMLGSPGQYFECGHEHAQGDRCLNFSYSPEHWEALAEGATLKPLRLPPLRELAPIVANACLGLTRPVAWEELSIELAAQTLQLAGTVRNSDPTPAAEARVTRIVRSIEHEPSAPHTLATLASDAGLSP